MNCSQVRTLRPGFSSEYHGGLEGLKHGGDATCLCLVVSGAPERVLAYRRERGAGSKLSS